MRWIDKLFEQGVQLPRLMNATQLIILIDASNANAVQHLCPRCIAIYLHVISSISLQYPGFVHKAFHVNTPQPIVNFYDGFKTFMPKQYRDLFFMLGKNRKEWTRILMKEIDKDQLSVGFGGTNLEAIDAHDFIRSGKPYVCFGDNDI